MSTRLWDALRAQWVWSRESNKVRWVWVVYKNTWKYMKFVRSLGLKQAKIALHDVLNFALPNLGNQIGRWERLAHRLPHRPLFSQTFRQPKRVELFVKFWHSAWKIFQILHRRIFLKKPSDRLSGWRSLKDPFKLPNSSLLSYHFD